MGTSAFNKVTYEWASFDDISGLSNDWVIEPLFINQERAMQVGPKFWIYNGAEITALTDEEILADPVFLAEKQKNKWAQIQAERDRRRAAGVKVGTNWFHSDDPSRIQQLGLVMFGANMPANLMWKTMAGTFVLMTPTLAGQIFQSSAASDMTLFTVAEQKKAAMEAAANPDTYDHLTGWPLIFGE